MIAQASATELVSVVQSVKPKKIQTPQVSATLEPEDVADLRAYCKEDGIYMPDHSTFAAALLRAELKSMGCTGCRRCGGNKVLSGKGFIFKEQEEQAKPRKRKSPKPPTFRYLYKRALRAYRKREAKRHGWMIATTPLQRDMLRMRGNDAYTWRELGEVYPELPMLLLKLCPNCKGVGTVPRQAKERKKQLTARPTGSSKTPAEGGGAEMDEEALHRRGKTDRRLAQVRLRQPKAHGVLQTYYQPGNETTRSLWRFTEDGRALLGPENPNGLTDRARITALLDGVHMTQDKVKQGMIDLADRRAQELLSLAIVAWNTIVAELVARSARDKNGAKLVVGATVLIFDGGKRRQGRIETQEREFWRVRCSSDIVRHVSGNHLERVA